MYEYGIRIYELGKRNQPIFWISVYKMTQMRSVPGREMPKQGVSSPSKWTWSKYYSDIWNFGWSEIRSEERFRSFPGSVDLFPHLNKPQQVVLQRFKVLISIWRVEIPWILFVKGWKSLVRSRVGIPCVEEIRPQRLKVRILVDYLDSLVGFTFKPSNLWGVI